MTVTVAFAAFTIFKNYTSLKPGMPPSSALQLDKSCPKPLVDESEAARQQRVPRTKEEAMVTRQMGPYTNLLRRYLDDQAL